MDRLTNYLLGLVLVGLLVLLGTPEDHFRAFTGFILAVLFSYGAFLIHYLTLGGARSAAVLGTLTVAAGGWPAALLLIFFFATGAAVTIQQVKTVDVQHHFTSRTRRDGLQVWSNGFWFAFFLLCSFTFNSTIFIIASVAALATATADTWATELGSRRFDAPTYLINKWKRVGAGTDGGVSVPGTVVAASGSMLISIITIYVFSLELLAFFLIFTAGFFGCLVDSYLGAGFQNRSASISLSSYLNFKVTNNFVNWASTGAGSITALILNLLIL